MPRVAAAKLGYNQALVQKAGLRAALYGGTAGVIEKLSTGALRFSPIGVIMGYFFGQIDAYHEMLEDMEDHDKRVEYDRSKKQ